MAKAGDTIGEKYVLKARLGRGASSEVWSAVHLHTSREFALKLMKFGTDHSKEAQTRFAREARASAHINHPSVIDVIDVGQMSDGNPYLVMERLNGLALFHAFRASPPLRLRALLTIVRDVASALAAAHRVDVVHRDIKPANIFLHCDPRSGLASAKILDFGISKFIADRGDYVTREGTMLGSPRYMSPEHVRGADTADGRADVWSLGVVLFEGLTGSMPFEAENFVTLAQKIIDGVPESIDALAPNLPPKLRAVCRSCLAPYEERPNAAALEAELNALLADGDIPDLELTSRAPATPRKHERNFEVLTAPPEKPATASAPAPASAPKAPVAPSGETERIHLSEEEGPHGTQVFRRSADGGVRAEPMPDDEFEAKTEVMRVEDTSSETRRFGAGSGSMHRRRNPLPRELSQTGGSDSSSVVREETPQPAPAPEGLSRFTPYAVAVFAAVFTFWLVYVVIRGI